MGGCAEREAIWEREGRLTRRYPRREALRDPVGATSRHLRIGPVRAERNRRSSFARRSLGGCASCSTDRRDSSTTARWELRWECSLWCLVPYCSQWDCSREVGVSLTSPASRWLACRWSEDDAAELRLRSPTDDARRAVLGKIWVSGDGTELRGPREREARATRQTKGWDGMCELYDTASEITSLDEEEALAPARCSARRVSVGAGC